MTRSRTWWILWRTQPWEIFGDNKDYFQWPSPLFLSPTSRGRTKQAGWVYFSPEETGSREASFWCLGRKLTAWLCCFAPIRITHLGYRWNWIYYMIKFSEVLLSKKHLSPLSINMVLKYRYDKNHYTCMFHCFSGDPNLWFSNRTWYICWMIIMIGKKWSTDFHLSLPILMAVTPWFRETGWVLCHLL